MNSEQFVSLLNSILDSKFEDFEKKIDQRFEKIDQRFEKIDQRFEKIDQRFEKIENNIKEIKDYINIESKGIENELGDIIKNHYRRTRRGDVQFIVFPIKKIHNYLDGNIITDFDYALIAFVENEYYQIILIETKHYITFEKINKKLYQLYKLKQSLKLINETNIYEYHNLFIKDIELLKKFIQFDKLDDNILFYIGGPTWEYDTEKYINELNINDYVNLSYKNKLKNIKLNEQELKKLLDYIKGNIGCIIPKGTRYKIIDNSLTHELIGGKYKGRFINYTINE